MSSVEEQGAAGVWLNTNDSEDDEDDDISYSPVSLPTTTATVTTAVATVGGTTTADDPIDAADDVDSFVEADASQQQPHTSGGATAGLTRVNRGPRLRPTFYYHNFGERRSTIQMPAKGEPFCSCPKKSLALSCHCGEEDTEFDWVWDDMHKSAACVLSADHREVRFHPDYSSGTAAVRGVLPMSEGQFYWEIKMITPVYGTDMMVGIGLPHIDLDKHYAMFCSLLGEDENSWGLSYSGFIYHNGQKLQYAQRFGQGAIIGVHLDMWNKTLSFYMNRKPLGVAFSNLTLKTAYPMVSSTAARSGMRLIRSWSFPTSLQLLCCQVLRAAIPSHLSVTDVLNFPPGLKSFVENNLAWLLWPSKVNEQKPKDERVENSLKRSHPKNKCQDCGSVGSTGCESCSCCGGILESTEKRPKL
ncbi:SPRY domain-containing SOCS box protein 3-like [Tubulanus polymorphus]|uniref:SPRY domain-containing SOCS box protein 3-like n=1 Tax=Tubulanus polymorphus TaxID=672921 RepID=UPI003DA527C4